jgi:hypothetical protein
MPERQDEIRAAIRSIVNDPQYGKAVLSSSQQMSSLLKDLVPDAPRETSILVAAAEADVAGSLSDHVSQGLALPAASALTARSFENISSLTPEACTWAVGEMAVALGLASSAPDTVIQRRPAGIGQPPPAAPPPPGARPAAYIPPQPAPAAPASYPQAASYQPPGVPAPGQYQQTGYQSAAPVQQGAYRSPAAYGQPGYQPFGPYGQPVQRAKTNGLAVAAMCCGFGQILLWFFAGIPAIILGFVALNQIKKTGEQGRGMAITGIVLGFLGIALLLVVIAVAAANPQTSSS